MKPKRRELTKGSYLFLQYDKGFNHAHDEWLRWQEHLKQIIIEDVPHKYQERLLKELCEHNGEFKNGVCLECGEEM